MILQSIDLRAQFSDIDLKKKKSKILGLFPPQSQLWVGFGRSYKTQNKYTKFVNCNVKNYEKLQAVWTILHSSVYAISWKMFIIMLYLGLQCAAESTHWSDSRTPPQ